MMDGALGVVAVTSCHKFASMLTLSWFLPLYCHRWCCQN